MLCCFLFFYFWCFLQHLPRKTLNYWYYFQSKFSTMLAPETEGKKEVIRSPDELTRILHLRHNSGIGGHSGWRGTYEKISQHYFWHGMKEDVKHYVCIIFFMYVLGDINNIESPCSYLSIFSDASLPPGTPSKGVATTEESPSLSIQALLSCSFKSHPFPSSFILSSLLLINSTSSQIQLWLELRVLSSSPTWAWIFFCDHWVAKHNPHAAIKPVFNKQAH